MAQAPAPISPRLASGFSLQFVQSNLKPDFDKVLVPLKATQTKLSSDCQAAGGILEGVTCKLPPPPPVVAYTAPVQASGTCADWIASAGISDVVNAVKLINWESGCNPLAVNPTSGACGVAQELECGKSGCVFGDGACQVKWMAIYVQSRYGSWANAVAHEIEYHWY